VSLFVVTAEGVLVADGQGSPDETRRMIETIAGITELPVTHVIICSDHGDHTGGNVSFPANTAFLAHPTSAATLREAAQREGSRGVVVPTHEVSDREVLTLGRRQVQILFLGRAHTGGDLVVYLPREKVLFMSETYLNRVFPAMRSAYPSEWVAMLERAQAMDVDTYVPGHGFVESPSILTEELETYRRALVQVIGEARKLHDAGLSAEEAVEAADFGELEHWSLRSSQGPIAVRRVYLELDGGLIGS
jgi:cyclase